MKNNNLRLLIACVSLLACGGRLSGQAPQTPWTPVKTDISTLAALSAEDKTEQLRDWALLSAAVSTGQKPDTYRDLLYRFSPVRIDMLRPLYQQRAGEDRWIGLPGKTMLALVPAGKAGDTVRIGRVSDEYAVSTGQRPTSAVVFEYQLEPQTLALAIRRASQISGDALYGADAGYSEISVSSAADVASFFRANLDLVAVTRRQNGLLLGGRKLDPGTPQVMQVSDVAALMAAGQSLISSFSANARRPLPGIYEERINEEVETLMKENGDAFSALSFADLQDLRNLIREKNPYAEFESKSISLALAENPPTIGFSLDPRENYQAIANDLQMLLDHPKQLFEGHLLNSYVMDVETEYKLENQKENKLLADLKKAIGNDDSPKYAPEKSALTLVGLEKSPAPTTADGALSQSADTVLSDLDPDEALGEARVELNDDADSAKSKKAVIQDAIAGLRAGNTNSWNAFRRYLEGQSVDVSIRRDSPKYQIRDLQEMLAVDDDALVPDGLYGAKTETAVKNFQTHYNLGDPDEKIREDGIVDGKTWRSLLSTHEDKADELDGLRVLFDHLDDKDNRQCARYDGAIQGTETGMTLFYTDLLMKLWSFAYENKLPNVAGFTPETVFQIDPIYWEEVEKYPDTRGWLGGQPAGVSFDDAAGVVRFAPVATRIYDASSNPLLNGKEVQANFSSSRFSSWWNAHYWEVANYEPQYHRLNQIMKWSAVINSFRDNPVPLLSALAAQPFAKNLKFNDWWLKRQDLKVHATVPFLQPAGETTECMAILQSDLFESMGGIRVFSGGVSTFTDAELDARRLSEARRAVVPELERQGVVDYTKSEAGKLVVPNEGQFDITGAGKSRFTTDPKLQNGFGSSGLRQRGFVKSTESTFTGGDGQLSISVKADTTQLYDFSVAEKGGAMQVDFQPSGFLRALDYVRDFQQAEGAIATKVELKDSFLLQSKTDNEWTLFAPDTGKTVPNKAVSAKVGVDGKTYMAQPVSAAEAKGMMKGTGWVEIADDIGGGGTGGRGPTIIAYTEPQPDDHDFTLLMGATKRRARGGDEGIMIGATPDEAEAIRGDLDAEDAAAFLDFETDPDRSVAARKTAKGPIAYASFGTIPDSDSSDLAALLAADSGKERTTVSIRSAPGGGVRFNENGSLELPSQRSAEDLAVAREAIRLASAQPELRTDFHKLGDVTPKDIADLTGASANEAGAYLEMRSVDSSKLASVALLDLRIGTNSGRSAFRTASQAGFLPMDDSAAVQRSYQYVEDLLTQPDRPDTVAEFREKSRPLFDYLKKTSAAVKTPKIVTLESGDFDMDAFATLHGGIDGVRFVRDIPNATQSLEHAGKTLPEHNSSRLILSTAPLDELNCATCSHAVDAVRKLDPYLPEFDLAMTWTGFRERFEDNDYKEITLIARAAGDGLVFADRWVSASEIRYWLTERLVPERDVLHLVTNGGSGLVDTFADSGKFNRVVLSRFTDGDIESFAAALDEVAAISAEAGAPAIRVTAEDLASLRDDGADALAAAIQQLQSRNGGKPEVSLADLSAAASSLQARDDLRDNHDWLRRHMPDGPAADLDRTLDHIGDRAKAPDIATRKAALELRALPLIKN